MQWGNLILSITVIFFEKNISRYKNCWFGVDRVVGFHETSLLKKLRNCFREHPFSNLKKISRLSQHFKQRQILIAPPPPPQFYPREGGKQVEQRLKGAKNRGCNGPRALWALTDTVGAEPRGGGTGAWLGYGETGVDCLSLESRGGVGAWSRRVRGRG